MLGRDDLYSYQNVSVAHLKDNTHAGLFKEMGLGKTVATLTALNDLMFDDFEVINALVIAPRMVVENVWKQEVTEWSHLKHLTVTRVIGNPSQRIAALKTESDIHVVSRDNIEWLVAHYGGLDLPWDLLIIDESSSFKNRKSNRFKAVKKVRETFDRIWILTGTPAPNTLVDLWSQIFILDGGKRLFKHFNTFRDAYLRLKNPHSRSKAMEVMSDYHKELITDKISDICISMKTEDCIELPPRVDNRIKLSLGKYEKKYKAFVKEKVLELVDQTTKEGIGITTAHAGVLSNKLLQFCNGAVYDEDKNVHNIHDIKLERTFEIIESLNTPVLVLYQFKHDLVRLQKKLAKFNPKTIKEPNFVEKWNNNEIEVLLMHPASGGHGLNLQKGLGHNLIWFGLGWNLELFLQTIKRIHRNGNKNTTFNHMLTMQGTEEDRVYNSLMDKADEQEALMQSVKALIEEYAPNKQVTYETYDEPSFDDYINFLRW